LPNQGPAEQAQAAALAEAIEVGVIDKPGRGPPADRRLKPNQPSHKKAQQKSQTNQN